MSNRQSEQNLADIARKYLEARQIPFDLVHSIERICLDGDYEWVVRFEASMPEDVVDAPSLILVLIDDRGNARSFETL